MTLINQEQIIFVIPGRTGGSKFTYNKDGIGGSSASDIGVSATTLTLSGATINTRSKFGIYTYAGSGSGGATLNHGSEELLDW